jgi:diguanylate cyclase (GGDEF)-like protein
VARFGGDEFVIVLADVRKANDAAEVAKKVIGSLKRPFKLAGREVFIGASIGISLYPEDATDADILLRNADMAMYRAKDAGRNNYQFFTLAMNEKVHTQMELERDLRLALERDELALRYQPIVDVSQGRMVGVEALLTWHHPEHGMVMPNRFIPLAEETGLIGPIGHWVLTRACQQLGVWQRSGLDLRLNVNLSSRQLALGLSVDEVVQALDDAELQPESISLEITEGLILEGEDSTLQWLERVKSLGVGLVVDDFGTGYSSLSYLKRFPMDTLKIDQSFVRDLPGDPENVTLVQTIIAMAHSLGLKVVAEGVETKEQLSFLISEDCSLVQGYYYSRPVWPEQIPALVLASLPISDESVMTVCD